MSKQIPLTRGQYVLVDERDYESLARYRWHCTANGYAARTVIKRKRKKTIYMHRELLKAPARLQVDHCNQDKLDNRRENLRLVTAQQNTMNRSKQRNRSAPYKGVSRHRGRWQARIWVDGKSLHLGYFDTLFIAASIYDVAARQYYGPYAKLNLPAISPQFGSLERCQSRLRALKQAKALNGRVVKRPSPYRGVYWQRGRWRAVIRDAGRKRHLGYFTDEIEAARAYDAMALRIHGPNAILNFPPSTE